MISFKTSNKMTDRQVAATRLLGLSSALAPAFQGTGLSTAGFARINERPTKASAVTAAAMAQAQAYGIEATANGAGFRSEQQHQTMWAFRGLEPWRDPA